MQVTPYGATVQANCLLGGATARIPEYYYVVQRIKQAPNHCAMVQ